MSLSPPKALGATDLGGAFQMWEARSLPYQAYGVYTYCPCYTDRPPLANLASAHRYRKVKSAPIIKQAYSRGMVSNGFIEIEEDDDESEGAEYQGIRHPHQLRDSRPDTDNMGFFRLGRASVMLEAGLGGYLQARLDWIWKQIGGMHALSTDSNDVGSAAGPTQRQSGESDLANQVTLESDAQNSKEEDATSRRTPVGCNFELATEIGINNQLSIEV
ncbi:PHD-finger domain-containing protein [Apiospora hydei]|uniref:PHD-finger domain-containing protein n=1 Tax=Apiospora hydei TaxID=1337664 RepID=A0ABR1WBS8_9PEZI